MLTINTSLENVLVNLQSQKDILVNKLQDEVPFYKSDSKNKSQKYKKKTLTPTKKYSYIWPEINRYYFMF